MELTDPTFYFQIILESGIGYDEVPETRKGYTGYEKDEESGLDFAQARYYNPKHGRYTSVDPLTASANVKNPQTFNRYSYVLNSPYKFVDPLGLISSTTGANGGAWCSTCDSHDGPGGFLEEDSAGPADSSPAPDSTTNDTNGPPSSTDPHSSATQQSAQPSPAPPAPTAEQNADDDDFDGYGVVVSHSSIPGWNCMAWALGFIDRWIEPIFLEGGGRLGGWLEILNRTSDDSDSGRREYLPIGEEGRYTLRPYSMVDVAKAFGANETVNTDGREVKATKDGPTPEGYYKIVVFEGANCLHTHVMRQEENGSWSSKNGSGALYMSIGDPRKFYDNDKRYGGGAVQAHYLFRKIEKRGRR